LTTTRKKPDTANATASTHNLEGRSYGVAYNFGDITVGADKTYSTSTTAAKTTGTTYGAAYAVTKDISVSVVKAKAEKDIVTFDEKIMQYAVGYNLGAISVGLDYTTIKNSMSSTNTNSGDVKVGGLKLATKF